MAFNNFKPGREVSNRPYLSSNTVLSPPDLRSEYHNKCIPREVKERVKSAPPRSHSNREYQACNFVKEEMKWEERCRKETHLQKKWYVVYFHFNLLQYHVRLYNVYTTSTTFERCRINVEIT